MSSHNSIQEGDRVCVPEISMRNLKFNSRTKAKGLLRRPTEAACIVRHPALTWAETPLREEKASF